MKKLLCIFLMGIVLMNTVACARTKSTDEIGDIETETKLETDIPLDSVPSRFIPGIGDMANGIKRDGPANVNWVGKWIWDTDNTTGHNWVCLRKTVTIDTVPEKVVTRIAIDSRYWLWINGKIAVYEGSLKRGPNENDTYFDTVDIAPYLQEGENTIAILGWYFGNDSDYYSYNSSGAGALLFQAELENITLISDASWKVRKHSGYLISTPETDPGTMPNYRLPEGNIFYDAQEAEILEGWYLPKYDDSEWENATEYGVAGDAPWYGLWQRSIPLLRWTDILSYENPEIYAPYMDTVTTETIELRMKCPYNMQIQPYLKVEAEAGLKIRMISDGSQTVRASYITADGIQEFESLGWMSCQTMTYQIPAGVKILELGYRQTGYFTDVKGAFSCDDSDFNQLWTESLYTLYITMRDTYMDCPDRERAQWWGDVTSESHMAFYALDADAYLLYRKGVDAMLQWRGHNGTSADILPTVVPINQGYFELPVQQLAGIVGFETYYQYTGDVEFLQQIFEPAASYLMTWKIQENSGLVEHNSGSWDWIDWGNNFDVSVIENAWYYWACSKVMEIGRILDIHTYDRAIGNRMRGIENSVSNLWNEEKNAYYGETANGLPDDRANALMVLSGLADQAHYDAVLDVLVNIYEASPYMEKYVLEAMFKLGAADEALERIKNRYASMLEDEWTTLWEMFPMGGSHNHAWSGAPLVAMSAYVAGIAPDKAGYDTYHVIPQLGYLNQVMCTVPSVKGDIILSLNRYDNGTAVVMTLTSPKNTVARVGIPIAASAGIICNGEIIYKSGEGIGAVDGVEFLYADNEYVYFNVQSGEWTFYALTNMQ